MGIFKFDDGNNFCYPISDQTNMDKPFHRSSHGKIKFQNGTDTYSK